MKIIAALCAFFIWAQTGTGYAQTFPDRAIRFIVPNPAGGSNDAAARILANALSELWPHGKSSRKSTLAILLPPL
jgi:tripartite-type tricarboxylate transporter receptor subunit TctC